MQYHIKTWLNPLLNKHQTDVTVETKTRIRKIACISDGLVLLRLASCPKYILDEAILDNLLNSK